MEKFDKQDLLRTLGKEINHLNDLRDLLYCLDLKKNQIRKVYLLQDLLKGLCFELYLSINNEKR